MWKLFIDDERWPTDEGWRILRSSFDAIEEIKEHGMPVEIAFDHDLGTSYNDDGPYEDTTMRLVHWIISEHYDRGLAIPANFTYSIHSQNPIGAANIKGLMDGFLHDIGRA